MSAGSADFSTATTTADRRVATDRREPARNTLRRQVITRGPMLIRPVGIAGELATAGSLADQVERNTKFCMMSFAGLED